MRHLLELMGINDILHVLNVQTVSQVGSLLEFNHVPTQSSPLARNPYHISSKKKETPITVGFGLC